MNNLGGRCQVNMDQVVVETAYICKVLQENLTGNATETVKLKFQKQSITKTCSVRYMFGTHVRYSCWT